MLGDAELLATLNSTGFQAGLKTLERDVTASFGRMAGASEGIISGKAFSGASGGVKGLTDLLKPLEASLKTIAADGVKAGSGVGAVGAGAARAKGQTDPLKESIRGLANELNNYKVRLEAGEVEQADFVRGMQGVIANSKTLRDTVNQSSTEYGRLTNIIGTSTRSITTAEGRVSALGLSQQVALGHTSRLTDSVKGLGTGVVSLGNVLPGVIGVAGLGGLVSVAGDLATKANAANVAGDILGLTIDRLGVSSTAVEESISNTATTLGVAEGQVVDYATQLLRIGVSAEQIDDVLIAGGSSALAFGKSAAQGLDSVTNALVTGNSANLQTIGISENVGAAMNKAAESADGLGEAATKQASAQAGVNIVLKATQDEVDSLDKLTGGLTGAQNKAATATYEAKQALGELLIPLETMRNEALVGVLGLFGEVPAATQASVIGIGGVTTGVAALSTGLVALRPLLAATFLPPAGFIVLGVTAAAALGTAIFTMAQQHETAVEKLGRLETAADNLIVPLDDLKAATSKEQLLGAVTTLADTMDGDARAAFENYATAAVDSAASTGAAVIGILQGVAIARKELKQEALGAAQDALRDAQANLDQISSAVEQAGPDSTVNRQLASDQAELATQRADLVEAQADLQRAFAQGNTDNIARYKTEVAEIKDGIVFLEGEIKDTLKNVPEVRINVAADSRDEALRTFNSLQTEVTDLTELIETGTRADLEGYFNAGAAGAQNLAGASEDAKTAFAGVKTQFDTLKTLDATGADNLLASLTSLKDTYPELKKALNPLIVDTKDYITTLGETVPTANAANDAAATALETTATLAARIGSEFQTGTREAASALDALQIPLSDLIGQRDALLASGNYDDADLKALNTQINVLETALDKISPDTFNTLGVGARAAFDPVAGLRAQLQGANVDLGSSEDAAAAWGAAYLRSGADAQSGLAGVRDMLEGLLATASDTFNGLAQKGATAFTDTVVPLGELNAKLADVDRNARLFGDTQDVVAQKADLYRAAIESQADLHGENSVVVKLLMREYEKYTSALESNEQATASQTTFVENLKERLSELGTGFKDTLTPMSELKAGLQEVDRNARLTGDASSVAADKVALYETAMKALAAQLGENNPLVLLAKEGFEKYSEAVKIAADTTKALPDAYRAAEAENELFNSGLSTAQVRADVAREALQNLINQGVDPQSEAVRKAAAELDKYEGQVDSAALANEALNAALGSVVDGLGELGQAWIDSSGMQADQAAAVQTQLEGTESFITNLISGNIPGAIGALVGTVFQGFVDMFGMLAQGTELAGEELEQYRDAAVTYGDDIANKYIELDNLGRETFDDEAFAEYEKGLERLDQAADNLNDTLREIDSGYASVQDAEVSAREDALGYKLDSQEGVYTFADVLEEQTLAIGRAAQDRDAAYEEAAALDAAGQHDLATRRRTAGDSAYQVEVDGINANARGHAEEIGQATQSNLNAIDANAGTTGAAWTEYWNQDSNAQIEAQRQAREQLRRQEAVMNSQRYADLLKAGYDERTAYESTAYEMGYTIDSTTSDLVTAEEAAGQARADGSTQSAKTTTQGLENATTLIQGGLTTQGTQLQGSIRSTGSLFASVLATMHDGALTTLSTQANGVTSLLSLNAGVLSSAFAGYGEILAGSINLSGDFVNSALAASLSGEVGTLVGRSNILGTAITDTANRVSSTHLIAGNFEKDALFKATASKQLQQQTSVTGLVAGIAKSGNFEGGKIIEAANFVARQHLVGGEAGVSAIFNAVVGQTKQLELGSNLLAKTTIGGGNHVIKADADAALAKAKQFIAGGRLQVDQLFAVFQSVIDTAISGNSSVASALAGNKGAASAIKRFALKNIPGGLLGGGAGLIGDKSNFSAGRFDKVGVEDIIKAGIEKLLNADQLNLDVIRSIPDALKEFLKAPKKDSLDYLDQQISDLEKRYGAETDLKKRKELAKKINDLKKQRDKMDVLNPGAGSGGGRDAATGGGKGSGKGKGGGSGEAVGGADRAGASALDLEIERTKHAIAREKNPAKKASLKRSLAELERERKKLGGTGSGASKGGSSGTGSGKGSGSGKGGSSGTGSKKDGSTYSGGKPENYPEGSPGWYAAKMAEIEEQIKRASSKTKIRQLQAAKQKLQGQLDTLLGQKDAKVPKPAKGSIDYLQEQIQKEQTKFDSAVTDRARAESSERLRVLKAELEEKQAILKDAEKEIARDSSNVITIESPIANLDGITQLSKALDAIDGELRIMPFVGLEENLETQFGKAIGSVKGEFKTMPFTGMDKGFATQLERTKGKQAISDRLPDFTASSTLPAYQAQLETGYDRFDSSTIRFDNATIRFDRAVSEFVRGSQGGRRDTSTITDKARGNSLSVFGLQP